MWICKFVLVRTQKFVVVQRLYWSDFRNFDVFNSDLFVILTNVMKKITSSPKAENPELLVCRLWFSRERSLNKNPELYCKCLSIYPRERKTFQFDHSGLNFTSTVG